MLHAFICMGSGGITLINHIGLLLVVQVTQHEERSSGMHSHTVWDVTHSRVPDCEYSIE